MTITLVTISVMQFTHTQQVARRRTGHWVESLQAELLAESGIIAAKRVLSLSDNLAAGAGVTGESLLLPWARLCLPPSTKDEDQCPSPGGPLSQGDLLCDLIGFGIADKTGLDATVRIRIEDATGKVNLNALPDEALPDERRVSEQLFLLAGVSPRLIGPITDWVDAGGAVYAYGEGAEAGQYSELDPPYPPANGLMTSFRELELVRGMAHEDLVKLRKFATVLPTDEIESININTAPLRVLRSLRGNSRAFDDPGLIAAIHRERCSLPDPQTGTGGPFADAEDLESRIPNFPPEAQGASWIHFESNYFEVKITARVGDVYQSVEALLNSTDGGYEVVYALPRRGAIVEGADISESTDRRELDFSRSRRVGAF